ncbi:MULTISPECIES: hypothetical protein [Pseudomonas]|uniref:hypothetical protein n=1 Tax=Pseudomonas TaxID=286 RepID=UPI000F021DDE|nr:MULTISPECIES: hypothetical protein [Pseudomonas]MBD8681709.1 hypothetical protein [Pseudomonas sp. CFBP 13719]
MKQFQSLILPPAILVAPWDDDFKNKPCTIFQSWGLASAEQKNKVLGKHDNLIKFPEGQQDVEIWMNKTLIGAASVSPMTEDDLDDSEVTAPSVFVIDLADVIIRRSHRGYGYGRALAEAAGIMAASMMTQYMMTNDLKSGTLILDADFVSDEGAAFYDIMDGVMQPTLAAAMKALGKKCRVESIGDF